jgi:L-threonylcarbamoyladenylate synthase
MPEAWTADEEGIARAAARLAEGGLVGVPTETVYGLAADAASGESVVRIFEAKGRPRFNPLIAHVLDEEMAGRLVRLDHCAGRLIAAFWPGPLTLVLPRREDASLSELATAGLDTVAVRSPAHPVARTLLEAFGKPFVAPSANRSGRLSPTSASHVRVELPGVPVLDGGPCAVGVESTVVSLLGSRPALLRPGAVAAREVEAVLGHSLAPPGEEVRSPGMLASHYAPDALLRLGATEAREGEVQLGFGGTPGAALDLSPGGDLREAAANLFAMLRTLDGQAPVIAVAPIPEEGLGAAINDRLRRAAAPR